MIGRKKKAEKEKKEPKIKLYRRVYFKFKRSKFGRRIIKILNILYEKIEESLRFELMVVFSVCFLMSFVFYGVANDLTSRERSISRIEYNTEEIITNANSVKYEIENSYNPGEVKIKEEIQNILNSHGYENTKIYITDLEGKTIFKNREDIEEKIDIFAVMNKEISQNKEGNELYYLYPIIIGNERAYLVYSEIPTPYVSYEYYYDENPFLSLILSVIVFIALFTIITNRKMKYIEEIEAGLRVISGGDLSYRIEEKGKDEIKNLAANINNMAYEIETRIENERKSEKTKNELITNVSHDLRTPLTSVMGYIGLVKEGKYKNDKEKDDYLNVAFNKSNQLKVLIDDLFEYTKLNNKGILLEKGKVNIVELLSQIIEEYIHLFEDNNLTIEKNFHNEKTYVEVDPGKIVRVFENLFSNAIKYSDKPGNVIIFTKRDKGYVNIGIKNKGDVIDNDKLNRLFERFYRVDEARNSNIKGSGLGLAISKNIVELHGGRIWAEALDKEITFYVSLKIVDF
ncbi:ATP-binding protein [Clostridium sp.]|uniref:sensor histidine kinase n=1 Tax=Clostridium sp. TaxID=1506 RepID=UPI0026156AF5|nr:ATP-binding protein [Clostridium sp.]